MHISTTLLILIYGGFHIFLYVTGVNFQSWSYMMMHRNNEQTEMHIIITLLRLIYDGFCISFVYKRVILSSGAISYEAQVYVQTKMYISIALLRINQNEFQLIKLAQQSISTYVQLFSKILLQCRTSYLINLCYQYQTIAVFQQGATKFLLVEKRQHPSS